MYVENGFEPYAFFAPADSISGIKTHKGIQLYLITFILRFCIKHICFSCLVRTPSAVQSQTFVKFKIVYLLTIFCCIFYTQT